MGGFGNIFNFMDWVGYILGVVVLIIIFVVG